MKVSLLLNFTGESLDMTISDTHKSIIKITEKVSLGNNKDCLLCENICPCKVALYYDTNRDADPDTFVSSKILCSKHDKKISRDYKKAKKKLSCGPSFYKDLVYGTQLMLLRFHTSDCKHVDDTALLRKRLEVIFADYDELVLKKENKNE